MVHAIFFCVPQHLSISNGNIQVDASFMQTLWNVHPICSGSNIEEGRDFTQNNSIHNFLTYFSAILHWIDGEDEEAVLLIA